MDNLWLKVENIVAKGEIACFEQFLFCHYVFNKSSAAEASESVYIKQRVNNKSIAHDFNIISDKIGNISNICE